ncbi:hypothetical protein [Microbacterium sp. AK031]|uniref:hypothetical protein n=1 Tax=Microbacterium sp. AK031 TaxID=2723076 RepID=UPI002169D8B8|nr:hypothetical protein [Microbacterium sp. AK031]
MKPRIRERLAQSFADPVLRALVTVTAVSRIGREVFLTVTVLFFTLIIGVSAGEAAVVLAVSSACGVLASFLGGWLADRSSARRLASSRPSEGCFWRPMPSPTRSSPPW